MVMVLVVREGVVTVVYDNGDGGSSRELGYVNGDDGVRLRWLVRDGN